MGLSLSRAFSEVEAMAQKAARGAGYAWGLADEAAFAVGWLERHGQGGCAVLAAWLLETDHLDLPDCAPNSQTDWRASSGRLCPIQTGAALSDAAFALKGQTITFDTLAHPILVLPFVAHTARIQASVIQFQGPFGSAKTDGTNLLMSDAPQQDTILIPCDDTLPKTKTTTRADPDPKDWRILKRYASRTYAPATDASRLTGAGAGLTDND